MNRLPDYESIKGILQDVPGFTTQPVRVKNSPQKSARVDEVVHKGKNASSLI